MLIEKISRMNYYSEKKCKMERWDWWLARGRKRDFALYLVRAIV